MRDRWLHVKVHPNAGKDVLVSLGEDRLEAWVRSKPVDGRANEAVAELVARGLRIPRARLLLIKGRSGRHKVFKIIG